MRFHRKPNPLFLFGILALAVLFIDNAQAADYFISPKDILEIQIYNQPDLTQTVRVSEGGMISLSLIGETKAAGVTINELVRSLTQKYAEYIYTPQVSVYIKEYYPKEIYVLGEVRRPGLLKLAGKPTLLELLSQAGGVSDTSGDNLMVIERGQGREEAKTTIVKLSRLLSEGNTSLNVEVGDGATVYVPRADYFFVFGEVNKPGSYKLDSDMKITVMKAISLAGGFTEKAAKTKIRITREEAGAQVNLKADLNSEIRPQDIIIVPESFF